MSRVFHVKNWRQFQHYGDRSPKWIKLHGSTLDDYEFTQLPDSAKWHLVGIWLLASKMDNRIPWDGAWISRRIGSSAPVDLDALAKAGFIIDGAEDGREASAQTHETNDIPRKAGQDASATIAPCSENAILEKSKRERREREEKNKQERAARAVGGYSDDFLTFWKAYPSVGGNPKAPAWTEWQKAVRDVDPQLIIAAAKRYADASAEKDAPKVAHALTWLCQARWNDWAGPKTGGVSAADTAAMYERAVRRYYAPGPLAGSWGESYLGPPPGAPGCRVPLEILARYAPAPVAELLEIPSFLRRDLEGRNGE